MAVIIKNRQVETNQWQLLKAGADKILPAVPASGDIIVSTAQWLAQKESLLARQGRPGEAMTFYDQAIAARPEFFEALFNRGNLLLELKRNEEALESYQVTLGKS